LKDYDERYFPAYTGDIENTGYYGFPLHPIRNVLKIANHGEGYDLSDVDVTEEYLEKKNE